VPGRLAFIPASTSAVPMRMAMCMSWPQACITPVSRPAHSAHYAAQSAAPASVANVGEAHHMGMSAGWFDRR
jgi:hypothetical protein